MTELDSPHPTDNAGGPRVLVIDDDAFMRSLVTHLLRTLAVEDVHEAGNGSEALAAVSMAGAAGFDLMICDLEMPESDGMEFMRRLAESGVGAALLVLSGKSSGVLHSAEVMGMALGLNVVGSAPKPPTLAVIEAALQRSQPRVRPVHLAPGPTVSVLQLGRALDVREFEPFFQPKVWLESQALYGCEALVRWRHPDYGVLSPALFVPQVEAAGLMERLTFSMLEQSIAWCRRWHARGIRIPVSVNLSMSSLEIPDIAERIVELVRAADLVAADLVLEITETIAMLNVARCLETLLRFRVKGFGLSIDDFGTGFSSLQQLERVPYTELKIDRSFVDGAAHQERLRTVLETSVSIARRLGMSSVAEGVESHADWLCLRDIGCDAAQGYYIAKPMAGEDFLDFSQNWRHTGASGELLERRALARRRRASVAAPLGHGPLDNEADRPAVIVVADDDAGMRQILGVFLEDIPGQVHMCSDGRAALDAALRLRPDVMLVDMNMPLLRGDDLCRQIRVTAHTAAIPVLVITGDDSDATRRDALLAGATDVITKPLQKAELLMRIRNLIALQRAQREVGHSRLLLEEHKARHIRAMFARYVSPSLVDRILTDTDGETHVNLLELARRCHAVVLFADLRGFTQLSEILEPVTVAGLLDEFFAMLVAVTHEHDGTTLSMAGDCLLVAFNVPYTQGDAEARALRAAQAMHAGFESLASGWESSLGVRAGLGIGINAGKVVAGNIGAPSYVSFTLIGDTVNVAARLKDRARAGEILVTEQVLNKLDEAQARNAVKVPVVSLKGKREPMDVYSFIITPRAELAPSG